MSHEPLANISVSVNVNNVCIKSVCPFKVKYDWKLESFVILIELSSKLLANLFPSFRLANAKLMPNGCSISDLHVNDEYLEQVHK